ncbi:MAG: hypothetical protein ACLUVC_02190 [Longibaculum sp.]
MKKINLEKGKEQEIINTKNVFEHFSSDSKEAMDFRIHRDVYIFEVCINFGKGKISKCGYVKISMDWEERKVVVKTYGENEHKIANYVYIDEYPKYIQRILEIAEDIVREHLAFGYLTGNATIYDATEKMWEKLR